MLDSRHPALVTSECCIDTFGVGILSESISLRVFSADSTHLCIPQSYKAPGRIRYNSSGIVAARSCRSAIVAD